MSKFAGVLFDLDGTLLDTYQLILQSFRYATRQVLGETIPDEQLMAKVGQPLSVQMWDFAQGDQQVHDELFAAYQKRNQELHDSLIAIFPDTVDVLERLRQAGVPLGVVTSKRHDPAIKGLSRFGLVDYFQVIIGADDWPEHKPQPGPVLHGCEVLGLQPSTCLYVGDSAPDIQAGNAAGCATAAVLWGMFSEAILRAQQPTFVCKDGRDVVAIVLGDDDASV